MGIFVGGVVMFAASPARIMESMPAPLLWKAAGGRLMILAGEAASITTPKKEYPYPNLTPSENSGKEGQDQVLVLFLGFSK